MMIIYQFYMPFLCNIQFRGIAYSIRGRLQKRATFNQVIQSEDRPDILTPLVSSIDESITADGRLRPLVFELAFHESSKTQDFIDNKACRNVTMIDRYHASVSPQGRAAATEHHFEIYQGQEVSAQVRDAEHPSFRSGYPRYVFGQHQYFSNLIAACNKLFLTDSKSNTDPFGGQFVGTLPRDRCAAAPLQLLEQLERLFN